MADESDLASLLRMIRDQQREQLALQVQAIELQRAHFALAQSQIERVERINDRAEAIQARASATSKVAPWVIAPALVFAIVALLWSSYAGMVSA
ncbi:hypothetical protein ACFFGH_13410 [Lysobacter korlensis]|uniref:Uncharacterized protein n=1 Tax=Lysobacter korlensis TaxID=553636 RepID=A0ABV6RPC8_9GAMM